MHQLRQVLNSRQHGLILHSKGQVLRAYSCRIGPWDKAVSSGESVKGRKVTAADWASGAVLGARQYPVTA